MNETHAIGPDGTCSGCNRTAGDIATEGGGCFSGPPAEPDPSFTVNGQSDGQGTMQTITLGDEPPRELKSIEAIPGIDGDKFLKAFDGVAAFGTDPADGLFKTWHKDGTITIHAQQAPRANDPNTVADLAQPGDRKRAAEAAMIDGMVKAQFPPPIKIIRRGDSPNRHPMFNEYEFDNPVEAANVVQQLEAEGVPHQLSVPDCRRMEFNSALVAAHYRNQSIPPYPSARRAEDIRRAEGLPKPAEEPEPHDPFTALIVRRIAEQTSKTNAIVQTAAMKAEQTLDEYAAELMSDYGAEFVAIDADGCIRVLRDESQTPPAACSSSARRGPNPAATTNRRSPTRP